MLKQTVSNDFSEYLDHKASLSLMKVHLFIYFLFQTSINSESKSTKDISQQPWEKLHLKNVISFNV